MERKNARPTQLSSEQVADGLLHHFAADFGDGAGERNVFRAGFHAILRVATFLDATIAHQRGQALALQSSAGGVGVKQPDLRNGRSANEAGALIELRTYFHAAATRDATGERISELLRFGVH